MTASPAARSGSTNAAAGLRTASLKSFGDGQFIGAAPETWRAPSFIPDVRCDRQAFLAGRDSRVAWLRARERGLRMGRRFRLVRRYWRGRCRRRRAAVAQALD